MVILVVFIVSSQVVLAVIVGPGELIAWSCSSVFQKRMIDCVDAYSLGFEISECFFGSRAYLTLWEWESLPCSGSNGSHVIQLKSLTL